MAKTPSKPTSTTKQKAAARKAAASIPAARKTPSVAKSETTAKKSVTAKKSTAVKKPAAKAPLRKTAAKKSAPQKAALKSSSAKISLQAQLDSVAKRLTAADRKTQKNIKSLEADFSALAAQMNSTKAGHTKLTSRVTRLSNTLKKDLENLQSDVKHDLSHALHSPTLEGLQAALSHAENRLTESEAAQDTAIMRINRHIADIATIVDARLSNEAQTREAAMAEMKQVINTNQAQLLNAQSESEKTQSTQAHAMQLRFSNLQSESAEAIRSIGDKVVDVAEEMGRRRKKLAAELRQDLNEAALSSSTEFDQFRRVVERRLEALEVDVRDVEGYIDRAVAPLSSRIEGLEYGLSQAPAPQPSYAPSLDAAPPMSVPAALAAPALQAENGYAEARQQDMAAHMTAEPHVAGDAFSPAEQPAPYPAAPVVQSPPAMQPHPSEPLELTTPASPQAVPYNPSAFPSSDYPAPYAAPATLTPQPSQPYAAQPQSAPVSPVYNPQQAYAAPPVQPNQAQPGYLNQAQPAQESFQPQSHTTAQPPFPKAEDLAVIEGDLPYADPAYAETQGLESAFKDDSMKAARPGAFDGLKTIGRKKTAADNENTAVSAAALMTPRNLKLGGLVAALGVVGFLGAQTLANKDITPQNTEFSVASNAALDETRPSLANINNGIDQAMPEGGIARSDVMATAPKVEQNTIGQYADNRKMALAAGGESLLSAAAKAGNPAAQLQLGLETLDKGDLDTGVSLIRAAANQEQPAALYRLAKLYETGQGVGQDSKTARQLTERAARGGNRIAMHDLALYYAEEGGRGGVKMDMPTAAAWFEKAAQRGVVDSQYNLGILFESGQGLPQDLESALVWYSIAGAQGDQMAAGRVSVLRQTLSEDQVERADTRIAAFTPSRIDEQANGIFTDVPWAKPSKVVDNKAAKSNVVKTQTLLNELGYSVGTADGAIGPKTKNAILNFQRNNALSETGVVNAELIERLEMAAGA